MISLRRSIGSSGCFDSCLQVIYIVESTKNNPKIFWVFGIWKFTGQSTQHYDLEPVFGIFGSVGSSRVLLENKISNSVKLLIRGRHEDLEIFPGTWLHWLWTCFFFPTGRLQVWPTRIVVMTRERLARESVMLMPFRFGTSVMLRPPDALHFPTCGRGKLCSWVCHVCKWVMTSADSPRTNHLLHDRLNRPLAALHYQFGKRGCG